MGRLEIFLKYNKRLGLIVYLISGCSLPSEQDWMLYKQLYIKIVVIWGCYLPIKSNSLLKKLKSNNFYEKIRAKIKRLGKKKKI